MRHTSSTGVLKAEGDMKNEEDEIEREEASLSLRHIAKLKGMGGKKGGHGHGHGHHGGLKRGLGMGILGKLKKKVGGARDAAKGAGETDSPDDDEGDQEGTGLLGQDYDPESGLFDWLRSVAN
jgi:hypothetical protein